MPVSQEAWPLTTNWALKMTSDSKKFSYPQETGKVTEKLGIQGEGEARKTQS